MVGVALISYQYDVNSLAWSPLPQDKGVEVSNKGIISTETYFGAGALQPEGHQGTNR